ncbi:MAG: helix-turn-helix domain-containing protein [Paracoccaceae bacterium]
MTKHWLPPLLNEIADVAGVDAAIALAKLRGGSRISIPKTASDDHWITVAVGREAADAICAHFSGGGDGRVQVDLPLGPTSAQAGIRRAIDAMLEEGRSADDIARTLRVHRSTVFRRAAARGASDDQPDLFDR